MKSYKGVIKNWRIISVGERQCVMGNIFGHPGFTDGHFIRTSYIVSITYDYLETRNSTYVLEGEQLV